MLSYMHDTLCWAKHLRWKNIPQKVCIMRTVMCEMITDTLVFMSRIFHYRFKQKDGLSRQSTCTFIDSSAELVFEMQSRCGKEEIEVGDTRHLLTHVLLVSTLAPRGFESSLLVEECQNTHSQ